MGQRRLRSDTHRTFFCILSLTVEYNRWCLKSKEMAALQQLMVSQWKGTTRAEPVVNGQRKECVSDTTEMDNYRICPNICSMTKNKGLGMPWHQNWHQNLRQSCLGWSKFASAQRRLTHPTSSDLNRTSSLLFDKSLTKMDRHWGGGHR